MRFLHSDIKAEIQTPPTILFIIFPRLANCYTPNPMGPFKAALTCRTSSTSSIKILNRSQLHVAVDLVGHVWSTWNSYSEALTIYSSLKNSGGPTLSKKNKKTKTHCQQRIHGCTKLHSHDLLESSPSLLSMLNPSPLKPILLSG